MSSETSTLTVIIASVAAVGSIIAATAAILNYRLQAKKDQPTFIRQTFVEASGQDGKLVRKVRVLHPNKALLQCQILFNSKPLIWDKTGTTTCTIEEGGGGNVVVPDEIFSKGAKVAFKANGRVLKMVKFSEIEGSEKDKP